MYYITRDRFYLFELRIFNRLPLFRSGIKKKPDANKTILYSTVNELSIFLQISLRGYDPIKVTRTNRYKVFPKMKIRIY